MLSRLRVLFGCGFLIALSGCASMTGESARQMVLVRSNPPGASIYIDGARVGQTPELIELRRGRRPKIQIEESRGRREVELETRYRWGRSFGRGFVFLTYAPIAWLVDILTGTAWDAKEPDPFTVKLSASDLANPKASRRPPVAVIAPPRSSSAALSDSAGQALEKILGENESGERFQTRPYQETLSTFVDGEYEYLTMDPSRRHRLLKELDADYVFESKIERLDDRWQVSSEGREIRGTAVRPGPSFTLSRDSLGPRVFGVGLGLRPWWSRILPDTVGLDFLNEAMSVEVQGATFALSPVYGDEWWARGVQYINAIHISSTPDRRREVGSRWEISAVPSFRLSRKTLKVTDLPPPQSGGFIERDPQFSRWAISGGYGLEVGYLIGRHYIYLDVIPVLNWSEITWRQNMKDQSATRVSMGATSELGYTYVFDSNWLIRIFSRSSAESIEVWQDALVARLGPEYTPAAASGIMSGFTIGYRFDVEGYRTKEAR